MGRTALSFLGETWNMRFVKIFKVFTSYINFARWFKFGSSNNVSYISYHLRIGSCYQDEDVNNFIFPDIIESRQIVWILGPKDPYPPGSQSIPLTDLTLHQLEVVEIQTD